MPEFTDLDMVRGSHSPFQGFQGGFAKSENYQQVAPNRLRRFTAEKADAGDFQLESTGGFELQELASQSSRMELI